MLHGLHCISAYLTGSCSTEAFGELRACQQPRGLDNGPQHLLLNLFFFFEAVIELFCTVFVEIMLT